MTQMANTEKPCLSPIIILNLIRMPRSVSLQVTKFQAAEGASSSILRQPGQEPLFFSKLGVFFPSILTTPSDNLFVLDEVIGSD